MPKGVKADLTPEQKAAKKAEREKSMAENFVRLAEARVTKALDAIANVGGISNRATYSYTPEQAAAIGNALDAQLTAVMAKFAPSAPAEKGTGFSLSAAVEAVKKEEEPSKEEKKEGE